MSVLDARVTHNASAAVVDVDVAARFLGSQVIAVPFSFEVAAADDNGSIYRFASIPANAMIKSLKLYSDAITGMTSVEFGVYKPLTQGGAVIDRDAIAVAVDISAGKAVLTEMLIPTSAAGAQDAIGKPIGIVAGIAAADMSKYSNLDVCLYAGTVGSAAGTIAGFLEYVLAV